MLVNMAHGGLPADKIMTKKVEKTNSSPGIDANLVCVWGVGAGEREGEKAVMT